MSSRKPPVADNGVPLRQLLEMEQGSISEEAYEALPWMDDRPGKPGAVPEGFKPKRRVVDPVQEREKVQAIERPLAEQAGQAVPLRQLLDIPTPVDPAVPTSDTPQTGMTLEQWKQTFRGPVGDQLPPGPPPFHPGQMVGQPRSWWQPVR